MNAYKRHCLCIVFAILFCVSIYSCQVGGEKHYYGVEMDGVICGFSESKIFHKVKDEKEIMMINEKVQSKSSLLGANVDTKVWAEYQVDPETGYFSYHDSDVEQGKIKVGSTIVIDGDTAHVTSKLDGKTRDVSLPEDVILENSQFFPHLIEDFVEKDLESKVYQIFDVMDGEVQETLYKKVGMEEMEMAGGKHNALVLDELNYKTGLKLRWWINAENGYLLKAKHPMRTAFLANSSIKYKVERVNLDNYIFAKADVSISDIKSISYLKVKASLEPTGAWITQEDLNVPGQSFEGTVEDNTIKGIFEISHPKYDGTNAPPFPPDFSKDEGLQEYLIPEDFIESDDPVLSDKAEKLTRGAKDSWDAAKRLSKWVAEEIGYDIPGGGSARKTYELREGECGAHSRLLAAFCRAVGIPARVVWGCMYVPNLGGSFGQHGWNEIYMGEAGWIPVDATFREVDYSDSGHIRLSTLSSLHTALNPKKMEILDFQAGSQKMGMTAGTEVSEKYAPYIGNYQSEHAAFKTLVQNGNLAVDIPGKGIFEMNEPDESGDWYFKITEDASISFQEEDFEGVMGMTLCSKTRLPKREDANIQGDVVPEKFRSYLGKYPVPMQDIELVVIFKDGNLAVNDPNQGIVKLKGPDEEGLWIDQWDKNKISFDTDETGNITSMIFHSIQKLSKE
jgi:transglutaminase-like putative cysteine protease